MITVYTDGGARGNPGPAASAFLVYQNKRCIYKESYFIGTTTNNLAEYFAVLMALTWIDKNKDNIYDKDILFNIDSELVVKQLMGEYKIKNDKIKNIVEKINKLEDDFNFKIKYHHVRRSLNKDADRLVNKELDANSVSR